MISGPFYIYRVGRALPYMAGKFKILSVNMGCQISYASSSHRLRRNTNLAGEIKERFDILLKIGTFYGAAFG